MGTVSLQFYHEVMNHIGAPINKHNIQACDAWQAAEGGDATWNPWNTTQPAAGATNYNSAGVKNYPNRDTGISATVKTLKNGSYPHILAAFRAGTNGLVVCEAVDKSPWGTKQAAATYRDRFVHHP
jgi:hypothetical protein